MSELTDPSPKSQDHSDDVVWWDPAGDDALNAGIRRKFRRDLARIKWLTRIHEKDLATIFVAMKFPLADVVSLKVRLELVAHAMLKASAARTCAGCGDPMAV